MKFRVKFIERKAVAGNKCDLEICPIYYSINVPVSLFHEMRQDSGVVLNC